MKRQPQTLEFFKCIKCERIQRGWSRFPRNPANKVHGKKNISPQKKSLRQVLVLIQPYLLALLDATLTFLCPDFGKEEVLPRHLSWDLTPVGIEPFSGGLSHHLGSRGTELHGRFPGQEHSRSPCLTRCGPLPQLCTGIWVCFLPRLPFLTPEKAWATSWRRPQRAHSIGF